jgi:endonuclease G
VKLFSLPLLLIVAFFSFGITSKELKNVTINNSIYNIVYSQNFEQPLEISYTVKCNRNSKNYYSRKGLNFYKSKGIHTSDDADYYNNVWDKGHMTPAADFNCDLNSLKLTFSYVNCALQHKDLNRGPWKELEAYEKELAINNVVTINILVDFSQSSRLHTGAMIPTGFSKIITLNGKKFKAYYFPNQSVNENYEKFLVKRY